MRRALPLVLLLSACSSSPKLVGGNCSYQPFQGTCRFVALERGAQGQAWAFYALEDGGSHLGISFSIDDERLAAFEAHLRAHLTLPCRGERIVTGSCVPMLGHVEIPSFEGATTSE